IVPGGTARGSPQPGACRIGCQALSAPRAVTDRTAQARWKYCGSTSFSPPSGVKYSLIAASQRGEISARAIASWAASTRSEEHTSELQSRFDLVCRLLLEEKNIT